MPHYLAVFWAPLGHSPGDIIGGIVIVSLLSAVNIIGVRESARVNFVLAVDRLRDPAPARVCSACSSCSNIDTLIHNIHLGVAPTWKRLRRLDHRSR